MFHIKIGRASRDAWTPGLMLPESNPSASGSEEFVADGRPIRLTRPGEPHVREVDEISTVAAIRSDVSPLSPLALPRHYHSAG